jgi:pyruvate decarboxylase
MAPIESHKRTLGHHIASRLVEVGCTDFFTVPGDFNLLLLDQLLEASLTFCCHIWPLKQLSFLS